MRKISLVAAAVATVLLLSDSAMAYWNGPVMAPPPIPHPPGAFARMPAYAGSRGRWTYPATDGERNAGPTKPIPATAPTPRAVDMAAAETDLGEALPAAQQASVQTTADECARSESPSEPPDAAPAAQSARLDEVAADRLAAELAQVRSELVASTRRVNDLIAERDELKAQFGSNMGDVASVRNAFEQVRKRAVEVGIALSDSQGTDVGGGFERAFLKADLERLIAALALADAVLSDAGSRARAREGAVLRTQDWQGAVREAELIEAASFEADR